MKKLIVIAVCMLSVMVNANAQIGNVFNKVKSKASQRADSKIDQAIDKGLDKVEGKDAAATASSTKETDNDNSGDEKPAKNSGVTSFSKYDFIAGEQVVYYDNFEQDAIAELPANWNTNGSGEVVTLNNAPGKWLRIHHPFNYLTANEKQLSENYTIEFDLLLQLKNNGWIYPTFSIGIISTNDQPASDNAFLKGFEKYSSVISTFYPGENKSSHINMESAVDNKDYFTSAPKQIEFLEDFYGKPIHVAIQVQKERYRMWVNAVKAFDVPKGVTTKYTMNQLLFQAGSSNYKDDQYAIYLSNIKVAQGLPDTRHKLLEEGKFSTTAILFDVNTAIIKPESGGVLKEIAGILDQNKEVQIRIIGHTDNDGADAANLTLSKKRSAAIKDALVNEYKIADDRIETDGKGETAPAADNKTKEGKAQNRRVEFIKL